MALPKLNETPMYELTVPSTGQKARYRPYLVKEEKVLMMAYESQDTKSVLRAVVDTISSCLEEGHAINLNNLTTFDVEYMFTRIRSKSVGEVSKVNIKCGPCKALNEYAIDLDTVEIEVDRNKNMIEMAEGIFIEMRWPSYLDFIEKDIEEQTQNIDAIFDLISESIVAVHYKDERIDAKDQSKEELKEFVTNLTSSQFQKLANFFEDIPTMKKNIEFNCVKCGEKNEMMLKGMSDFF